MLYGELVKHIGHSISVEIIMKTKDTQSYARIWCNHCSVELDRVYEPKQREIHPFTKDMTQGGKVGKK